jgi:hypothetical protein
VQPIIRSVIEAKTPNFLSESAKRGGLKVTMAWTRHVRWTSYTDCALLEHLSYQRSGKWKAQTWHIVLFT